MKTKLFFTVCFALCIAFVSAQNSRIWATYFGGSGDDYVNEYYDNCVATDGYGNVYIAGYTNSTSGIASGGFQNTFGGGSFDAYLVKLDATGNLLWATYYGGANNDYGYIVTTDTLGNVYLAGKTNSTASVASGGFQNTFGGGSYDAFLVKFDGAGNRLWATYYGGTNEDVGWAIATDVSGNVYLEGYTISSSGIAAGGFQNTLAGGGDAYLVKFNSSGNRLWATYYGGSASEYGTSVATDASENVYLAGYTNSTSGIAFGGFQNSIGGDSDAMLIKFDAAGNRIWATYYGGAGSDDGYSVATDNSGNVYLSGVANSSTGIASGGFQNTFGGGVYDAFLVKFNGIGNRLWATYYGDVGTEFGNVATNTSGNVYLAGYTTSTSNISSGGFQNTFGGGSNDSYLVSFDSSGNRICATYYGGTMDEFGGNIATDASDNVYLAGLTNSTSGISSMGFQNSFGGGGADAYLVKFASCSLVSINENKNSITIGISPNPFSVQTTLRFDNPLHNATLTVDNYLGQTVAQIKNISGQTITFNRDNLPSGLYCIRLIQDNKIMTTNKLVITD